MGLMTGVFATLFLGGAAFAAWWIVTNPRSETKATKPSPPATVDHILKEDAINGVKLTPEAEKQLGITLAPVVKKPMPRTRTYGGEVMIPVGHTIMVAAPLGGTLQAPEGGVPPPGTTVRKNQPVIQLLPLLTPEARTTIAAARVDAEGQVNNARAQLEATRIAFNRAKRLLSEQAGSQRNVDEAQAQFELAQKTLDAATARRDMLIQVSGEVERGTAAPITIPAPANGLLRTVSALTGQNVPSGAALFEVADLSQVWVRVPVFVGDLQEIATTESAAIGELSVRPGAPTRIAKPALAPPSANSLTSTGDLYYELDNREAKLAPGQRVGVTVPLRGETESLAVPWSAVIHDIYGGTWVYEETAPHSFRRQRVQVRHVAGDWAALATGPAIGRNVVAQGAAELFGTEVGFSK